MEDFLTRNRMFFVTANKLTEEHVQPEAVLFYVLSGDMQFITADKKIKITGENVLAINPDEKYEYKAAGDTLFVKLILADPVFLQLCNGTAARLMCNSSENSEEKYQTLRDVLKKMLTDQLAVTQNQLKADPVVFRYISLYYQVLEMLSADFMILDKGSKNAAGGDHRILEINRYIRENYSAPMTLRDLAGNLFLSEGYLSRYFKKNFSSSFTDYLKHVRLNYAMEDLMYSDKSITRIAGDNGFSSLSFFNHAFKEEFGKTASAVRSEEKGKDKAQKMPSSDRDLLINGAIERFLDETAENEKSAAAERGDAKSFSVKKCSHLTPIWNQIINIGSAEDLLKSEIQEHVILIKKNLKFQYVRFWNIFSDKLFIDINNKSGNYNFSRLDQVLDFIITSGLKPFFDFEEKENRINESIELAISYEPGNCQFDTVNNWQMLIRAFTKHCLKRYGQEEMSSWIIEVWYGGYRIRGFGANENFYTQFDSVYRIVKEYVPDLKIGGPGFLPEEMYREVDFWNGWTDNAKQPDFVSLMNYAYNIDTAKGYTTRSIDSEYLFHDVGNKKKYLRNAGITTDRVYVSEFNITISDRNLINDTCFHGACIVKSLIDIYGSVSAAACISGSDRTAEYYDSSELLHGGKGLISKDSIFKPSAFAIQFLNKLYPYYIGKSDHYIISKDKKDNYSIVCHNMRKLGYLYFSTSEEKLQKERMEQYFEDSSNLEIEIHLDDVANGTYLVRTLRVNNEHGSILDAWKDMGYYSELSSEDIGYLRKICEPKFVMQPSHVTNHKLELKLMMQANEIAYINIEKQE